MINLKALALTALAATALITATPKAEAGVAMCDQAFKTGYTGTCYDMNGKAWNNGGDWKAGIDGAAQTNSGAFMGHQPAPVSLEDAFRGAMGIWGNVDTSNKGGTCSVQNNYTVCHDGNGDFESSRYLGF